MPEDSTAANVAAPTESAAPLADNSRSAATESVPALIVFKDSAGPLLFRHVPTGQIIAVIGEMDAAQDLASLLLAHFRGDERPRPALALPDVSLALHEYAEASAHLAPLTERLDLLRFGRVAQSEPGELARIEAEEAAAGAKAVLLYSRLSELIENALVEAVTEGSENP